MLGDVADSALRDPARARVVLFQLGEEHSYVAFAILLLTWLRWMRNLSAMRMSRAKLRSIILLLILFGVVAYAAQIERKTFSVSLPAGWTEDTKDDMYDANSFVFFENPESCVFSVIIGIKANGASVEQMLSSQKASWEKKLAEPQFTKMEKWGQYSGTGYDARGKLQGTLQYQVRLFGFETADNTCVITETSTVGDAKKFSADFDAIRRTFRLK